MIIHNMEQYSPEWWTIHKGLPTASAAARIITPKTGKLSAQSETYMNTLLAEIFGYGDEPFNPTDDMANGTAREPESRYCFSFVTGLDITQVGFITNDDGTAGCSPDGLICEPGAILPSSGLELKCPKASTHIGYLRDGGLPAAYKPQCHFSMAITGLDTWHFMSYFPGLEPLIVLVERDEYTENVERAIKEFTKRLAHEATRLELAA